MTESKKRYKEKIVRKYIEIYPSERDILEYIELLKGNGVPFQRFAKQAINLYIKEIESNGYGNL